MKQKGLISSKTIWVNVVAAVIAGISHFGYIPDPEVSANIVDLLVVSVPVINVILRFYTDKKIVIFNR